MTETESALLSALMTLIDVMLSNGVDEAMLTRKLTIQRGECWTSNNPAGAEVFQAVLQFMKQRKQALADSAPGSSTPADARLPQSPRRSRNACR